MSDGSQTDPPPGPNSPYLLHPRELAETGELLEWRPQHDDSRNDRWPTTLHTLGILLVELWRAEVSKTL